MVCALARHISKNSTPQISYTFTTHRERDPESGLMHYRARSYDPRLGRFVQKDSHGMSNGPNMYLYAMNRPTRYVDPSGNDITEEHRRSLKAIVSYLKEAEKERNAKRYMELMVYFQALANTIVKEQGWWEFQDLKEAYQIYGAYQRTPSTPAWMTKEDVSSNVEYLEETLRMSREMDPVLESQLSALRTTKNLAVTIEAGTTFVSFATGVGGIVNIAVKEGAKTATVYVIKEGGKMIIKEIAIEGATIAAGELGVDEDTVNKIRMSINLARNLKQNMTKRSSTVGATGGRKSIDPNKPAEEVLSGSLKRKFPSEHLGKSLTQIEQELKTAEGEVKRSLQTAKKLIEQQDRLLEK